MDMKIIVAPTDFSSISLNAVNYAADMAIELKAELRLLHVCQVPTGLGDIPIPASQFKEMMNDAEERMSVLKKEIITKVGIKLQVETDVVAGLAVTSKINDYCLSVNPFFLVIGTQGASAAERVFYGAKAVALMKELSYPVIVVPSKAKFAQIRNIGLACDLKKTAATIPVNEIRKFVSEFTAALHVLHINRESEPVYTSRIIEESSQLVEMLSDFHPKYHFLHNKDVEEGLTEFAVSNHLDLLMVIPKKHNLFDQLFHKSHTKNLMLETQVPLMSIHD
jgi:nucleotide-binding universal stress UspA family protein